MLPANSKQSVGTITKFSPVYGNDSIYKYGSQLSINTFLQCITAMNEYGSKCIEELRFEDYQVKRKFGVTSLFGSSQQVPSNLNTTPSTGGAFGSSFGTNQPSVSLFGSTQQVPSNLNTTPSTVGVFGWSFGTNQPSVSLFGSTQQAPSNLNTTPSTVGEFGSSFGTNQPSVSLFGSTQQAPSNLNTTPSTGGAFAFAQQAPSSFCFSGFSQTLDATKQSNLTLNPIISGYY